MSWQLHILCYSVKNSLAIFAHFEQAKNLFQRNSVTYRTPCRAIGDFVVWYHHVTYRTPWHVSGHLVIYREWYEFERAFFLSQAFFMLHSFLMVSRPPWGRQFNLKISRDFRFNYNNPQKRYGDRFYLMGTAGWLIKNLSLTGLELFSKQVSTSESHALSGWSNAY